MLRQYAQDGSEEAFRQLVQQHLDLVYSTARRLVGGDRHLAEDVAQTVFADLARKAGSLGSVSVLAGWLHRHTCFVASNTVRTEQRRRRREKQACEMNALHDNPESEAAWRELAPVLDQAINRLRRSDRDALILRFFQRQDLRTVGLALGLSEDAAQKRISRALEKLRSCLGCGGAHLSTAVLAALLGAHAVSSAPAALMASLPGVALASATVGGVGFAGLLLQLMTPSKLALAGAVTSAALLTAVTVQQRATTALRQENAALRDQLLALETARSEQQLIAARAEADEVARLRREHNELMRLRGEVTLLRHRAQTAVTATPPVAKPARPASKSPPLVHSFTAALESTIASGQTLITGGWATKPGHRTLVFVTPEPDAVSGPNRSVLLKTMIVEGTDQALSELGLGAYSLDGNETSAAGLLTAAEADSLFAGLKDSPEAKILSAPRVTTADGQQAQVAIQELRPIPGAAEPLPVGPLIDLVPRLSPDGKTIHLTLLATLNLLAAPAPGDGEADASPTPSTDSEPPSLGRLPKR